MICVIIAGGSGSRLWPLSTPEYPKHLLSVNEDEGTLLQMTVQRAQTLTDKIYIVSEAGHANALKKQLSLPETAYIIEPGRRGTGNCIIAALAALNGQHDSDDPIIFMHADSYIRDTAGFTYTFRQAARLSRRYNQIVMVGAEPDFPVTGFGYIQKGEVIDEQNLVFRIKSFKEKPNFRTAQRYLKSGHYLWNCGYFVGSLATFTVAMKTYSPELQANYEALLASDNFDATYLNFESLVIDYELIEKVQGLLVVPAAFDWMDLGSFADMAKAVEADEQGNHVYGAKVELHEVTQSFIQNYEDKPLAVIGLDNCVVVNTPHGIVVARKDLSQKVGEVSKRFL